jgi:hypothetical protein
MTPILTMMECACGARLYRVTDAALGIDELVCRECKVSGDFKEVSEGTDQLASNRWRDEFDAIQHWPLL